MEILLNLAWAACSLTMILLWIRGGQFRRSAPRHVQAMALFAVVLLLLPVISLSDDLVAAQSLAESDCCVRRALHPHDLHPSQVPGTLGLPPQRFDEPELSGFTRVDFVEDAVATPNAGIGISLDSRPPPEA